MIPPYAPHVYDTPDAAESTRYPIDVGLAVWTVDDESEPPQPDSSMAEATVESRMEPFFCACFIVFSRYFDKYANNSYNI